MIQARTERQNIRMAAVGLVLAASLLAPAPALAQYWSRTWAAAPQAQAPANAIPDLTGKTLRQTLRISSGGVRFRVRLSNECSDTALKLGSVHVAEVGANGEIVPGSDRTVTFSGVPNPTIPDLAPLLSDPVSLPVVPLSRLAVSIYLPDGARGATIHAFAGASVYAVDGDQTAAPSLIGPIKIASRMILEGIDVETTRPARTVVAFGDSITDGLYATPDANRRWPDDLAARLQAAGQAHVGVANLGISGNRILTERMGTNAIARFDRDVLSVPGISHVIILEGVNDLGFASREDTARPAASDIIGGYRQMIVRAHDKGLKVILATIMPYKGAAYGNYWSVEGNAVRKEVNDWILHNELADGVIDFAQVMADPGDPDRLASKFDSGDALHPNDAGFLAMADAIDLKLLQ